MPILTILVAGMAVGALAQLVLGRRGSRIDWTMALVGALLVTVIWQRLAPAERRAASTTGRR